MLSMLPKQGMAQSLFVLSTLMWQSFACGLAGQISARLSLQTGTAQRMRYLDLSAIRAHLPNNVATLKSLIGMHIMTGGGSTSTISGRGKRATFELLKTPCFRNTMSLWRNSFHVSCARYGKTSFLNCATACSAQGLAELANFPHVEMLCGIARCLPSRPPAESPGGQARYPASQWPWMDTRHRRCVVHSLDGPASCTSSAVGAGFMWLHHWVCNKTMHMQDQGMPCTDVCQCSWYEMFTVGMGETKMT